MKIKVICANKDLCYALTAHLTSHGHPVIMPGAKDFSQPDVYLFDCAMIGTPAEAEVSGY